ncbi:TraB domain-containing protein [Morella rubra]|uniref:TraB domain-containing protein n=1 Tax=Morella rubra TaxID=262757 RepID=A0A6A1VD22_9ROSI|nr:TraB domain-containing protein [Morella rubra]
MEILKSIFPIFNTNPLFLTTKPLKSSKVSIKPPPPDFDFRSGILEDSRAMIARTHPELLDLAENGSLVLVERKRYGPVPAWRTEFVEPELILLLGTTHISQESASDAERVVRVVKPDNVVVELCRSRQTSIHIITSIVAEFIFRAGIMYASSDGELVQQLRSNMFSLSGTGFFGAVGRSIDLGGQTALALRLLLAVFSSKISSDINRPFGDEFRAARKASEEVGAQIVLGDRPIEITLERAWNSLKWTEKLSLVTSVIRGITSPSDTRPSLKVRRALFHCVWVTEVVMHNLISFVLNGKMSLEPSSDDGTFQLYEQLSLSYPSLLQPLIHERDTYLAWSLKRSKAVNNSKRVVGVIGKGHMNGVIYALVSDQGNLRFRDLAGKRPDGDGSNRFVTGLLKSLVRDTVIGIVLWAFYEQIKSGL